MNRIKKPLLVLVILTVIMAFEKNDTLQPGTGEMVTKPPVYKDPTFPVEKRVEDLLSRMTIEEKIGQMNMPCVYISALGSDIPTKTENVIKITEGTFLEGIGPAGGFFTLGNNILFMDT